MEKSKDRKKQDNRPEIIAGLKKRIRKLQDTLNIFKGLHDLPKRECRAYYIIAQRLSNYKYKNEILTKKEYVSFGKWRKALTEEETKEYKKFVNEFVNNKYPFLNPVNN